MFDLRREMRVFGQKRIGKAFVAIARALAANPETVLYDEPTTMVDPLTSRRLINLIAELKLRLKLTSVIVTHDTRLAEKLADHVIFLEQAKVVFSGTVTEMQRQSYVPCADFPSAGFCPHIFRERVSDRTCRCVMPLHSQKCE